MGPKASRTDLSRATIGPRRREDNCLTASPNGRMAGRLACLGYAGREVGFFDCVGLRQAVSEGAKEESDLSHERRRLSEAASCRPSLGRREGGRRVPSSYFKVSKLKEESDFNKKKMKRKEKTSKATFKGQGGRRTRVCRTCMTALMTLNAASTVSSPAHVTGPELASLSSFSDAVTQGRGRKIA